MCRAFRLPNAIRCPDSAKLAEVADLGKLGAVFVTAMGLKMLLGGLLLLR